MADENDLTGALGKLLSDPEMLSKAMKIASSLRDSGALSGVISGSDKAGGEPEERSGTGRSSGQDGAGGREDRTAGEERSRDGYSEDERAGVYSGSPNGRDAAPDDRRSRENRERLREDPGPDRGVQPAKAEDGGEREKRRRLLTALRPYLSRERQEMIDAVLKILRLLELAESLGGIGSLF